MNGITFFIVIIFLFSSCGDGKNYKDAYIIKVQNQLFVKLTGKRSLNDHNPVDVVTGKSYTDSLLIPITTLNDGTIIGDEIPVREGYYKYKGKVIIKGKHLHIDLFYDNYDDKKLEPLSWNGDYRLIIDNTSLAAGGTTDTNKQPVRSDQTEVFIPGLLRKP